MDKVRAEVKAWLKEAVRGGYTQVALMIERFIAAFEALEAENAALKAKVMQYDHDRNVLYDLANKRGDAMDKLEAENAALLQQMQEMVRMAAEKNRPAYDEQQRVIMELRDENAALRAELSLAREAAARGPVLSADGAVAALLEQAATIAEGDGWPNVADDLRNLLERAKR
jgi:hypothetical protein